MIIGYQYEFFKLIIHNGRYAAFIFEVDTLGRAAYCASVLSLKTLKVDTGLIFLGAVLCSRRFKRVLLGVLNSWRLFSMRKTYELCCP